MKMTPFIPNVSILDMKLTHMFILTIILTIAAICLSILIYIKLYKICKSQHRSITARLSVLPISILLLPIILIIIEMTTYSTALRHGLYKTDITFNKMLKSIEYSPVEDKLPNDTKGCIIIYYKFGCPDCEAVYDELYAATKDNNNIYWISTRSITGKKLLESYPVEEVPSGIYIKKDTKDNDSSYVQKILYETHDDSTVFAKENLERLLFLQSEGR